jgi:hypothetical protein
MVWCKHARATASFARVGVPERSGAPPAGLIGTQGPLPVVRGIGRRVKLATRRFEGKGEDVSSSSSGAFAPPPPPLRGALETPSFRAREQLRTKARGRTSTMARSLDEGSAACTSRGRGREERGVVRREVVCSGARAPGVGLGASARGGKGRQGSGGRRKRGEGRKRREGERGVRFGASVGAGRATRFSAAEGAAAAKAPRRELRRRRIDGGTKPVLAPSPPRPPPPAGPKRNHPFLHNTHTTKRNKPLFGSLGFDRFARRGQEVEIDSPPPLKTSAAPPKTPPHLPPWDTQGPCAPTQHSSGPLTPP